MRNRLLILLTVGITQVVLAQKPVLLKYGEMVSEARLKDMLTVISSDSMEGRKTGTQGQKMAAAFIREHFKNSGLIAPVNGDYYQMVRLYKNVPGQTYLKAGKQKFTNMERVLYFGNEDSGGEVSLPLVFAGLGREEDFVELDVKDKAVLIRIDDGRLYSLPEVTRARANGAKMIFIWNTDNEEDFNAYLNQARYYQANAKISIRKPTNRTPNPGYFILSPSIVAAVMNTSPEALKKTAKESLSKNALSRIKAVNITYKTEINVDVTETENVLGFLEGTDKKDEVLIITAHYDHIGKEEQGNGDLINNGADDDGSGTVAVMELARIFAKAKADGNGPRRSILFMTVTGEEEGLLGSSYYTQNPIFPLSHTVVDLNMDMIGRRDQAHKESDPYVYIIGSDKISTELHQINESVNKKYCGLVFDYTYNDENHPSNLYYRSDHWNFAKNNIPIIFFFDGIHEDYHKPSDELRKIGFDLLKKRAQCVFYTAWEIANRENRILPDSESK
ncbi:MAG TPA: M28 family peptidase [Cyclobacteriaceae bacterium]|nr:M28 family peptidase [Cyclobacteriaceae bacterium]